ncbi:MAG: 50S ribosomal protein L25/general stress protein Ctc [Steroidobacteraceae bacterium]|jgi:large subunit ribosomal protein L25
MRIAFSFSAEPREAQGKGASRRLRHMHKVPAILYGGHAQAEPLALEHHKLLTVIADERFYSSIVQLKIGERTQEAIVKDVQMHPAKNQIVHVDLQRVTENEPIRLHVPIHFAGEAGSPGVKTQGGVVSHMLTDVEIVCLPKDLPEYLELDLSQMNINETKFLADIPLPSGVSIPHLAYRNAPVVSIHSPRVAEAEPIAEAAAPAEGAPAAAGAAAATAAAAEAAPAETGKAGQKKEGGKK